MVYTVAMQRVSCLRLSLIAGICGVALLTASASAQDLSTCSGNYTYCVELARRAGQTTARCEAAYQQCMRTGNAPDYYNPRNYRQTPVERK